jgi:hypothetical protein
MSMENEESKRAVIKAYSTVRGEMAALALSGQVDPREFAKTVVAAMTMELGFALALSEDLGNEPNPEAIMECINEAREIKRAQMRRAGARPLRSTPDAAAQMR